jgi:hypothetical protein
VSVLVAVVAAVAVSAAACGSSDDEGGDQSSGEETSAEAWADDVCSSASSWENAVTEAGSTLGDPKDLSVNDAKDAVSDVVAATSTFVTEVSDLGPPDTEAGEDAQALLETLADNLEAEADVLNSAIDEDANTATELLASTSTVTGALSTMSADIQTTLQGIDALDGGAELQDAFAASESCQQVGVG